MNNMNKLVINMVVSKMAIIAISTCCLSPNLFGQSSYCPGTWTSATDTSSCTNSGQGCTVTTYTPDKGSCKSSLAGVFGCNEFNAAGQKWITSGTCVGFGCNSFGGTQSGPYPAGSYTQHTSPMCS